MFKTSTAAKFIFTFILSFFLLSSIIYKNELSAQVSIQSNDTKSNWAATVHSLTGVPAGALLVLTTTCENSASTCSVSSSPSLTWTKASDAQASNSGDAEIYTAIFSAGGTISVTSNWGNRQQSSACFIVTGQETTLGGNPANATGQSLPSVNITTTRANSIIFCATSDWNAINGSSRTYRSGATERHYYYSSGNYTSYHYSLGATTATTYQMGLTAPTMTGNGAGTAVLEIRGPADAEAPTFPSNPLSNTSFGATQASLTWMAASDNVGVTGYEIWVNSTLNTTTTNLSYTVTGLTASTAYAIYVRAKDAAGNGANSNTINLTTLSADFWSVTGNDGINAINHFLGTTDAQPLVIKTNNNEVARLTSAGNFGVGTNSPTYKLDVNGTLKVDGTAASQVQFTGNNIYNPGFTFNGSTSHTYAYTLNSQNLTTHSNGSTGISGSQLTFYNSAFIQPFQQPLTIQRSWAGVNAPGTLVLDNDVLGTPPAANGYKIFQAKYGGVEVAYIKGDGQSFFAKDVIIRDLVTDRGMTIGRGSGTSIYNMALGHLALQNNTTGDMNTALGDRALSNNTTGSYNTGIGTNALLVNTTGTGNAALGYRSMENNSTGSNNTSIGFNAMPTNTTGSNNTAVGRNSLAYNTEGQSNTAVGYTSLQSNNTGNANTGIGFGSLYSNTSGYYNTGHGVNALYYNTTGINNTAIGVNAGQNLTSGDNNIFIGSAAQPNISNTGSNQLNIGNWIYGDNGNIGIGVATPSARLHNNGTVRLEGLTNNNALTQILATDATGNVSWRDASTMGTGAWALNGNGGTITSNFIGTTDNKALNFKTNGIQRLSITENSTAGSNNLSYILVGDQQNIATNSTNLSIYGKDICGYTIPFGIANTIVGMNWSPSGSATNTLGRHMRLTQYTSSSAFQFYDIGIDQEGDYFITARGLSGSGGSFPKKMLQISAANNVGINMDWAENPTANFHTKGTLRFESINTNNALTRIVVMDAGGNVASRDMSTITGSGSNLWTDAGSGNLYNTTLTGKVGIGTTNLADNDYKLFVETGIRTRKIKVDQTTWSDYVFDPQYKLPTLKEIEEFIQKNKHLPDVLSAAEVEKNGLDLGDNQATLLKKIEELTLYLIEINKKVDKLSEENAALKKKLEGNNK